jgi:hypothetical protein
MLEESDMVNEKKEEKDIDTQCGSNHAVIPEVKQEDLTSIVQIDDSELPQSIKDKFKD